MLTLTKLRETQFIFSKPQSDFFFHVFYYNSLLTILCRSETVIVKLLNASGQTAARIIKAAGMSRVSVEGAHAPKLNMQNDSSVRVKCVLIANQGKREG